MNLLDDLRREPIKVYLRVKPLDSQPKGYLEIRDLKTVVLHPPEMSLAFKRHQSTNPVTAKAIQRFTFSRVFGPETNQGKVFEETSLDVVMVRIVWYLVMALLILERYDYIII